MSVSAREGAKKLIQQYFLQLTQGCGRENCTNVNCANGMGRPMDPTEAAAAALALAAKGDSSSCVRTDVVTETESLCHQVESSLLQKLANVSSTAKTTVTVSITANHSSSGQLTRFDVSGRPEACPISSLDAALSWSPGCDDLCVPSILLPHSARGTSTPRVLVCHDMMGGYQKDRFVQGHSELEDYYFYHWHNVEAFIYFSHHFLSLPPPCWTNAAHRNGRLSLGTMITEWKDGARLCARLLNSDDTVIELAHQMVMMAQYYQFDGWLINIENPINAALMDRLYTFLSLLTTGMHSACPWSKVIWYDSVTVDGNLKWQNSLNKMNQPFFDLCDGIFLNYLWRLPLLQASGALAAHRRADVYVGIDVFGRKCYGGGGYKTNKAMEVIKQATLSTAVFAPGWVYETQPKAHFFEDQDRFWSLLEPHCSPGEPHCLPIVSSFSRGCGEMVYVDGTLVHRGHWSNLSAQDLQPSFFTNMLMNNAKSGVCLESVELDNSAAYYGGSSLKLSGRLIATRSNLPATARFFRTDINAAPLVVSYSVLKGQCSSVSHFLQLQCAGSVLLLDPDNHCTGTDLVYGLPVSGELKLPDGWPMTALCRLGALPPPHCGILHQIFTGNKHPSEEWKTEYFVVSHNHLKGPVSTVGLSVMPSDTTEHQHYGCDFELNLGEIKILDAKCISPEEKLSYIENIHFTDLDVSAENNQLSFTLKWTAVNNDLDPITHCNIYSMCLLGVSDESTWRGERVFLGAAYANCFRLTGIHILSSDLRKQQFGLELRVQPVTSSRRKNNVNDTDSITVWFDP